MTTTTIVMATPSGQKLANLNSAQQGSLRRSHHPAGNYIASRLRQIFDDSSVFPESNYSTEIRKQRRWKSVVQSDYQPILNRREVFHRAQKPSTSLPFREPKEEPKKMFMQWKVPSRLTDNFVDRPPTGVDDGFGSISRAEKVPTPGGSLYNFKPASALPVRQPGSARPPSQLMPPSAGRLPTAEVREASVFSSSTFGNGRYAPSRSGVKPISPQRPRKIPKAQREKELFQSFQNHEIPAADDPWFENNKNGNDPMRLSLPPANGSQKKPPSSVQKWIGNASDKDRQVALDFITSMSGHHESGTLQEVVDLLKIQKESARPPQDTAKTTRYVRLLTPQTRDNAWMQQTWHHLPSHGPQEVNNKRAIYVVSNATVPRHFTIHPE